MVETGSQPIDFEEPGRYRVLGRLPRGIIVFFTFVGIVLAIIYASNLLIFGKNLGEITYIFTIMALFMPIAFLVLPAHPGHRERLPWYDILFAAISFVVPLFFSLHAPDIELQGWEFFLPLPALIMGLVFIPVILEGCRRAVNVFFCIFVVVFSAYPLFASSMPGFLHAKSYSLQRVVSYYIAGGDALIGIPMLILTSLLFGFLIFGVTLQVTGAGSAYVTFAMSLLGRVRGGMGKVSVITSLLVGTITGSVITNVLVDGPMNIPAMKKTGFSSEFAAGIEAATSTGGSLMPPVMGTAAFIMASFLGISYGEVALAAAIPAILYYFSLFIQIDSYAARNGLKGLPKSELPLLREGIKEVSIYLIAIAVLVYLLFFLRREAQAPYYTTLVLFALAALRKKTRMGLKEYFDFFEKAGAMVGELMPIMAGIGFVCGGLFITGLSDSFSYGIISLAGNNTFILIALAALTSFILGMGLTATACYILLAIVVAPALIQRGFDPLSVHLFIMYCGCLSYITPPVAIGAYAAAAIAHCSPMAAGFRAMRIGSSLFILPIVFIYNPAFILHATPLAIAFTVGTAVPGILFIGSSLEGYLVGIGRLSLLVRGIVLAGGILLVIPYWLCDIIGGGIVISLYVAKRLGILGSESMLSSSHL